MYKYFKKLSLFTSVFLSVFIFSLWIISFYVEKINSQSYAQNESNTFHIKTSANPDIIILGTSHGRQFSRSGLHNKSEEILNNKILNLSQGNGGGGNLNQMFWLEYYGLIKNKIVGKKIIYFIDPFIFTSNVFNSNNFIFIREPFSFSLLFTMVKTNQDLKCIFQYLRSKFGMSYIKQRYSPHNLKNNLCKIDQLSVSKRLKNLYPEKKLKFKEELKSIFKDMVVKLSLKNELLLIIPPTAPMGELPFHENLRELLNELSKHKNVKQYDHSQLIQDMCLYSDHDHLNKEGVKLYLNKLSAIINE